jgi:hypothetical protein
LLDAITDLTVGHNITSVTFYFKGVNLESAVSSWERDPSEVVTDRFLLAETSEAEESPVYAVA